MFKANVIGLDSYLKRLETAKKELQAQAADEIQAAAFMFRDGAARDLVSQGGDRGTLGKSISAKQNNLFSWTVAAGVFYAPFVEFGTKGKTRIPAGFEDVAAQFKGYKRGNGLKLYDAIYEWVKRKGIVGTYSVKTRRRTGQKTKSEEQRTREAAFLIARSIYKYGISPKPFFYKQYGPVKAHLEQRLKQIVSGI